MTTEIDDNSNARGWVGRRQDHEGVLTEELAERFCATFSLPHQRVAAGSLAPQGIHWCLALPSVATADVGPDGHPRRGSFLPPIALPRRMWAGGRIDFARPLTVGDKVHRKSVVTEVAHKTGRSGPLCFVSVEHEISTHEGVAIRERHDIVFRDVPPASASAPGTRAAPRSAEWSSVKNVDPVLLFRYSALTFNSHRIHYDRNYCIDTEKYPGLVVHGPLQATLLIHLGENLRGKPMACFSFRSERSIFDGGEIGLSAAPDNGGLSLWTSDQNGNPAMMARAEW